MDTEQHEDVEITGRWHVIKTVKIETGADSNLVLTDFDVASNFLDQRMITLIRGMGDDRTIQHGFADVNPNKSCNRSMSINLQFLSRESKLPSQRIGILQSIDEGFRSEILALIVSLENCIIKQDSSENVFRTKLDSADAEVTGPVKMKKTKSIARGKTRGDKASDDIIDNYNGQNSWNATYLREYLDTHRESEDGLMDKWTYICKPPSRKGETEEKDPEREGEKEDPREIGIVATARNDSADWTFDVDNRGETRHYATNATHIYDWEEQAALVTVGEIVPTDCYYNSRHTHPRWGLNKMKTKKMTVYVPNLEVRLRDWKGPSLVWITGEGNWPVTIEDIGDTRVFCVLDKSKPQYAHVIPDNEVWVRHDDGQTRQMVPAFLLCMTPAEDWMMMVKRSRDFEKYIDLEETETAVRN